LICLGAGAVAVFLLLRSVRTGFGPSGSGGLAAISFGPMWARYLMLFGPPLLLVALRLGVQLRRRSSATAV
ncbi:MAG: hypothetical protein ACREL5_14375, partial [Gemmatimonadales bacterium]